MSHGHQDHDTHRWEDDGGPPPPEPIDCRSYDGVTIGLIDALISVSRILAHRDFGRPYAKPPVREALRDLDEDADVRAVLRLAENA